LQQVGKCLGLLLRDARGKLWIGERAFELCEQQWRNDELELTIEPSPKQRRWDARRREKC